MPSTWPRPDPAGVKQIRWRFPRRLTVWQRIRHTLRPTCAHLRVLVRAGHRGDLAVRDVRHPARLAGRRAPAAHRRRAAGRQPRLVRPTRSSTSRSASAHGRMPRFLAKSELWKVPVVRSVLGGGGHIPVYRASARAGDAFRDAIDGAAAAARSSPSTRRPPTPRTRTAGRCGRRTASARIALVTGAPVIPVANWGTQDVVPPSGRPRLWPSSGSPSWPGRRSTCPSAGRPRTRTAMDGAPGRSWPRSTAVVAELRGEHAPAEPFDPDAAPAADTRAGRRPAPPSTTPRNVRRRAAPPGRPQISRPSRAFSTTSGRAGWIQYCPTAIVVRVQAELHGLDQRLDQRGRLRAHQVRAEQPPGALLGDDLAEAGGVLHRPAERDVADVLHLDRDVQPGVAGTRSRCRPTEAICGSVNTAAGTNRGRSRASASGWERLCADDLRLVVRDVLELVRRADVAERPDAVDGRAALVGRRPTTRPSSWDGDAGRVQVHAVAVRDPAGRDEQGARRGSRRRRRA